MARLGRPRNEVLYAGKIRGAENWIADRLDRYLENLDKLACGVWFEETTKDGIRRVYRTLPDLQSNEYLINRIMGKPTDKGQFQNDDLDDPESNDQDGNPVEP
jgi:hypothetical protein